MQTFHFAAVCSSGTGGTPGECHQIAGGGSSSQSSRSLGAMCSVLAAAAVRDRGILRPGGAFVNTGLVLTAIGTMSGAVIALVAWLEYARRGREPKAGRARGASSLPADGKIRDESQPASSRAVSGGSAGSGGDVRGPVILRPPIGRLGELRGRHELLEFLVQELSFPSGRFQILTGLGGIGKTAVALALAEIAVSQEHDARWVSGTDGATVLASMMSLASELGAPQRDIQDAYSGRRNPADVLWTQLGQHSGWLLVIDNVDDLEAMRIGQSAARDGNGWLRHSAAGLIVVTSRVADRHSWGRLGQLHLLGPLSDDNGAQVLLDLANSAGSRSAAARLSARLGGLPLALHQAGLCLTSPFAPVRSFDAYINSLEERFADLFGGGQDDQSTLTRTWEVSLDALERRGFRQSRSLLRVLACFAPSIEIPPVLLDREILGSACKGIGPGGVAPGLDALLTVGLATEGTAPHPRHGIGVTIHPLVADSSRLHATAETAAIAARLLHRASGSLRIDLPEDWPEWSALVPHLQEVLTLPGTRAGKRQLQMIVEAAAATCYALTWTGSFGRSIELADSVLSRANILGSGRAVLYLRFQRIMALSYQGANAEAERQYRHLITEQISLLGRDHPNVMASLRETAWVIFRQGRYAEAEDELRKLLLRANTVLGPENRSTLIIRTELGRAIAAQERYQEAEAVLSEALELQARFLGNDHQHTLLTQSEVADVLIAQGRYSAARTMLDEILEVRLRVFGPDYPYTLSTRRLLAKVALRNGDQEAAESELLDVIANQTRVLGKDHPDTLKSRSELAQSLFMRGNRTDVGNQLRSLLEAQTRILGESHPDTDLTRAMLSSLDDLLP